MLSNLSQSTTSLPNIFHLLARSLHAQKSAVWTEGEVASVDPPPTYYRKEYCSCQTILAASHRILAKVSHIQSGPRTRKYSVMVPVYSSARKISICAHFSPGTTKSRVPACVKGAVIPASSWLLWSLNALKGCKI